MGRRVLGLVRKRQTLALGEWKDIVRKTQDSEKASEVGGVLLEEAEVCS